MNRRPSQSRTRDGVPLPEGWTEHRGSRGTYYAHAGTRVTQWHLPTGPPTQQQIDDLRHETDGDQISQLRPGAAIELRGLQFAPQLNGRLAVCERWDHASGRVHVRLDSGELKAVRPENLVARAAVAERSKAQAPPAAAAASSVRLQGCRRAEAAHGPGAGDGQRCGDLGQPRLARRAGLG
uniref:WW domain-containing protein n=1 Tax=Alexandrium monilatum TaxID=311494 RepID=A0A7S4RCU8_9DINO